MVRKSRSERKADRVKRRAAIRRGMKIMLYEINQRLAPRGAKIVLPPGFLDYTVAIAEGGRDDAAPGERFEAFVRQMAARVGARVVVL